MTHIELYNFSLKSELAVYIVKGTDVRPVFSDSFKKNFAWQINDCNRISGAGVFKNKF